jgi:serine/threonine-protein kinase
MSAVRCSQGHENAPENRFCYLCGERLSGDPAALHQPALLGNRYRIVRELGHGGFGRTYLAEDAHRFNEPCVLKEFAPQVQGTYALHKAKQLFEREAGVLYRLQHPQIPKFREMFQAEVDHQGRLFLVQDYVEGKTYRQHLDLRRSQGQALTESQVRSLLNHLLPVLQYIHSIGVIHRDISPDNLILRSADQLPVLIDFGGVKQVAAIAASEFVQSGQGLPTATRLGKVGYAPDEQMQSGIVYPHSDLYALAMTVLVLLTGKEPVELLSRTFGDWRQQVSISPGLRMVLERMLSPRPSDRYTSAQSVMQALDSPVASAQSLFNSGEVTQPPPIYQTTPVAQPTHPPGYSPSHSSSYTAPVSPHVQSPSKGSAATPLAQSSSRGGWFALLLVFCLFGGLLGAGWWTQERWLPALLSAIQPETDSSENDQIAEDQSGFSLEEQARKAALRDRRQQLGVNSAFLTQITNSTYYRRYPDQQGRTLTTAPEDAQWRVLWDAIANEWLTLLETHLSETARQQLGQYTKADRDAWKQTVNQLYVGSRSLNDLTDAQFFALFPEQREQNLINQPIGQVWQAIAADTVRSLQSGETLEHIKFASGQFSRELEGYLTAGEGKIYTASLSEGQLLRANLQANPAIALLSIYLPRPTAQVPSLLEDSKRSTWSGQLTQSGYYEFVIVNDGDEPLSYHLSIAVDNVTTTEIAPQEQEAPEAKN